MHCSVSIISCDSLRLLFVLYCLWFPDLYYDTQPCSYQSMKWAICTAMSCALPLSFPPCMLLCCVDVIALLVVDCGDPGTPENGRRSLLGTTVGSVVTYECEVGHRQEGLPFRVCQANKLWTNSVPNCSCELSTVLACAPHDTDGTVASLCMMKLCSFSCGLEGSNLQS